MSRRIWRAAVLVRLALLIASWPVLAYAGAAPHARDAAEQDHAHRAAFVVARGHL